MVSVADSTVPDKAAGGSDRRDTTLLMFFSRTVNYQYYVVGEKPLY